MFSVQRIKQVAFEIFDFQIPWSDTVKTSNEFKINSLNYNHQVIVVAVKTETGEFVTRKFINN